MLIVVIMTYSFAQLIDMFPKAVPAAKRAAKAKMIFFKESLKMLEDLREQCGLKTNDMDPKYQRVYIMYYTGLIEGLRNKEEQEFKKAHQELIYLQNLGKVDAKTPFKISEEQIQRAREYPIADLLEVKRTFTLCIFHDDHKPSAKIYADNHMYCFSCGKNADAIDIYMALNGCDFRTAVRALAP